MQSINANPCDTTDPNQALQALKEKISCTFRAFSEQPNLLSQSGIGTEKIQQLIEFLFTAIYSLFDTISIQAKQQAATVISAIIKNNLVELGCERVTIFFYRALFNFKVEYKVKVFFFNTIRDSLNLWQKDLKGLYETGLQKLVTIVENQHCREEQVIQENVTINEFNENFPMIIKWREDRFEVYSTILLLSKIFLQEMVTQDRHYCQWLTQLIRRFNPYIINEKILNQAPKVIEHLLSFWFDFSECSTSSQNNNESVLVLLSISEWGDLYQSLNLLISALSPSYYSQKYGGEVYDYFRLSSNWENDIFYRIKQVAAKIYYRLIQIRYADNTDKSRIQTLEIQKPFILRSCIFSLEKMASDINTYIKNERSIGEEFIGLAAALLMDETTVEEESMTHLVGNIILPLIDYFLEEAKETYFREDPLTFRKIVEDCIQYQAEQTFLPLCVKLVQILCDRFDFLGPFILSNATSAFKFGFQHRYEGIWPPMSKSVIFLITTVLCVQKLNFREFIQSVRNALSPTFLGQLTETEIALFYVSLSYTMEDHEDNLSIVQYMMYSTIISGMSHNLRIFAFDFLLNVSPCNFDRKFLNAFINVFGEIGSMDEKWFVLQKILQTRIELFDPTLLLNIVNYAESKIKIGIERIKKAIANRAKYHTHQVYNNLSLCRNVAHQHEQCMRNPQLQEALWKVVYLGKMMMDSLNYDDQIMQIACELIEPLGSIPEGFELVIEFVDEIFEGNGFQGVHYYQFFEKVGLRCKTPSMLNKIAESIVKSGSYETFNPEMAELPNLVNLNNSIIVMQALLIKQGSALSQNFKADVRDILGSVADSRPELQEYPQIQCRLVNLSLALSLVSDNQNIADSIQKMVDSTNRKHFHRYDCHLFLHLVGEKLGAIAEKGRMQIIQIILYLLRWQQNKPHKPKEQDKAKFDTLLSYMDPPIIPENNLREQAYAFIQIFQKTDFAGYQKTLNRMSEIDLAELMGLIHYPLNVRKLMKVTGSRKRAGMEDYSFENAPRPSPTNAMLEENYGEESEEECLQGRVSKKRIRIGRQGREINGSRSKKDIMRQKSLAKLHHK